MPLRGLSDLTRLTFVSHSAAPLFCRRARAVGETGTAHPCSPARLGDERAWQTQVIRRCHRLKTTPERIRPDACWTFVSACIPEQCSHPLYILMDQLKAKMLK